MTKIIVEETDLVQLVSDVVDWDDDEVTIVYSSPLDENGEWQTDYGDAGNYTVLVAATDGKSITEEEVLLIVKKKNRAPTIDIEEEIEVYEGELVEIELEVDDPDGDEVYVTFSEPFDEEGFWQTGYEDAGEYGISITVHDGVLEVTKLVKVIVNDLNREPTIEDYYPKNNNLIIKENEQVEIGIEAIDLDGDLLEYSCQLDGEQISVENYCVFETDFDSANDYILELVVFDGEDEVSIKWKVKVENINRAPALGDLKDIIIDEGEKAVIELPATDIDGDILTYSIDEPIGEDKEWQTGYDDAGEYLINILISDGELEDEGEFNIIVNDVDRAPILTEIGDFTITEEDEVRITLEAVDPDGDEVYFLSTGFPEDAVLEEESIVWHPGYDFVSKPDNFVRGILDRLKLWNLIFGTEKVLEIDLEACGKEKCAVQTFEIKVTDVNRRPILGNVSIAEINETDKITVKPSAYDPDGDRVKFYFSGPLDNDGEWQTDFNDSGVYDVVIGVTDGKEAVEQTFSLVVNNNNRIPTMEKIADRKVNENETVWIKLDAADPDWDDELTLWVEEMPPGASFSEGLFKWTPDFDIVTERKDDVFHNFISNFEFLNKKMSQEKVVLTPAFVVSDGDYVVSKFVNVVVRNWNRAPEVVNATPEDIEIFVGDKVLFEAEVIDWDGDALEYEWDFGFLQGKVEDTNKVLRTFTSSGQKTITLKITDGRDSVEKTWNLEVKPKIIEEVVEPVVPVQPVEQPKFVTYVVEG